MLHKNYSMLINNNGELVKTTNFKDPKYIGDPLNAVKILTKRLMSLVLDITENKKTINYELIEKLATECNMPLCYGGINNEDQVERIIKLGVEKIAISTAAVNNLFLIESISKKLGSQSVVVVIDVKMTGFLNKRYEIFVNNGKKATGLDPLEFAKKVEKSNVGELIINLIETVQCLALIWI